MQGRIVFATGNAGKIKEIRMIMEDTGMEVVSMKDAGITADIDENGKTYEENALIKARAVAAFTNDIVMADDSGLEIDYLNKEPGIYSARYLGEDTPYSVKNATLIQRLEGVPEEQRTARFVCAIAAVLPDGRPALRLRAGSDMMKKGRTDSDMTPFSMYRSSERQPRNLQKKRRTRSATEEKRCS